MEATRPGRSPLPPLRTPAAGLRISPSAIQAEELGQRIRLGILGALERLEIPPRRRQTGVSEPCLDIADLGADILHALGEGVPQRVDRAHPQSSLADVGDAANAQGLPATPVAREGDPDRRLWGELTKLSAIEALEVVEQGAAHACRQFVAHHLAALGAPPVECDRAAGQ